MPLGSGNRDSALLTRDGERKADFRWMKLSTLIAHRALIGLFEPGCTTVSKSDSRLKT